MSQKSMNDEALVPFLLGRIDSYFQLVTLKASLILPADILLLAILIGGVVGEHQGAESSPLDGAALMCVILGVLAIFFSLLFSARATSAFLKSGHEDQAAGSLLFFGSIAQMPLEVFREKTDQKCVGDLSDDLAAQIHLLSESLTRKFQDVNRSIVFLMLGVTFSILHVLAVRLTN